MRSKVSRFLGLVSIIMLTSIPVYSQQVAFKTNLLSDITTTFNLSVEAGIDNHWTFDLTGNLNPWKFSDNKKFKHWLAQPEFRFWFKEKFSGHYLGAHMLVGEYNVGNIDVDLTLLGKDLSIFKDHRYEGWLIGGGFTYGYSWALSRKLHLDASIGIGYAHIDYEKYDCPECGERRGSGVYNYYGLTKFSLSLVYFLK